MFLHSKLLHAFGSPLLAAHFVLLHAIPNPNVHDRAIQFDRREHQPIILESRAPSIDNRLLFSGRELSLILAFCERIERAYQQYDFWFFVGNSGGYLAYCFDHERFKPIPMSSTRKYQWYNPREDDPENKGVLANGVADLVKYYDNLIAHKIGNLLIKRIMLVDHSSTGRSVEATQLLLQTMFFHKISDVWDRVEGVEWGLFNIIDRSNINAQGITLGVTSPRNFQPPIVVTGGDRGHVNKLLGDGTKHYRCQADYWPSRWHADLETIWQYGNRNAASTIREQIREYVISKNNRRLLKPTPIVMTPTSGPSTIRTPSPSLA